MARLSVIVPIFNVEPYLDECIQSLASQTFGDFEAILVDDGSTDASADIAERWAEIDTRFRYVHQPNRGPGPGGGRNGGLDDAGGELLVFVDSDDVIAPTAFEDAVDAFDAEPALDFATYSACRLVARTIRPSHLHDISHPYREARTTVSDSPWLMYDATPWNKVFRRGFFDDVVGRWAEKELYEDIVPMTSAHLRSQATAVLEARHYHWRARSEGSITASTASIVGDLAQLERLREVDRVVREEGAPELKRWLDWKALTTDLLWMTGKLASIELNDAIELHGEIERTLVALDSGMRRFLRPELGACYESVLAAECADTVELVRHHVPALALDRRSPTRLVAGPIPSVSALALTRRATGTRLRVRSHDVDLTGSTVTLTNHPPWVESEEPPPGRSVRAVRSSRRLATFDIDPGSFGESPSGVSHLHVLVAPRNGDSRLEVEESVVGAASNQMQRSAHPVAHDQFSAHFDDGYLRLAIARDVPKVASATWSERRISIEGRFDVAPEVSFRAFLGDPRRGRLCEIEYRGGQGTEFTLEVDAAHLREREFEYFVSLARVDNAGLPIPITLARSPIDVSAPRGTDLPGIRIGRGTNAQAFLAPWATGLSRAQQLVRKARSRGVLPELGARRRRRGRSAATRSIG